MTSNRGRMSKGDVHHHLAARLAREGHRVRLVKDGVEVVGERGEVLERYDLVRGGAYGWVLEKVEG